MTYIIIKTNGTHPCLLLLILLPLLHHSDKLFNVAIATIFAREVLEGAVIIGNYRTVILKSDKFNDARKQASLRAVTWSAAAAGTVAVLVAIAVAIPLAILSNDLDERVVEIIEGISKVVAAICIVQLSVKLPVWLGIYKKVSLWPWKKYDPAKAKNVDNLSIPEIRFNVAWNIWREVAECGVFLIPFFLGRLVCSSFCWLACLSVRCLLVCFLSRELHCMFALLYGMV